ncbi:MAG: tRNA (N(6)-L-threonylcarbamoyladenosine(37)-C(2))-methylthiotransferase MtaB [Peptococcaceae bacterium]|nr:tRNA (N(6)-L-threonylcarbamoyladenosine(37)-C(2))-methylthiotransferase MtaB [Peptococcaceae bacterium]
MKVCFLTLGCKVNQTESEALAQYAAKKGYEVVKETEQPDAVIINTCTVTATGSSKSRKLIHRIVKDHPSSVIVVMGCYSQISPGEVAKIEGVDLVVGTQDRLSIFDYLKQVGAGEITGQVVGKNKDTLNTVKVFTPALEYEELPLIVNESRTRAMLKIQDGCSQFCSYCIVPYARGPSRSRKPENIINETKALLNSGYKEIVLTGIHIGAYGQDLDNNINLAGLISELVQIDALNRLRLGSIEPLEFTDELLAIIAATKVVCHHFHIPLQSGHNRILTEMKRPYTTEYYADLLQKIRDRLPEAALAADVMAGFPGETEHEHQETLKFIEKCEFAGIHAFPYSRRPGTPAADMPNQVPNRTKSARVKDIIRIGQKTKQKYSQKFVGREVEVLVEKVFEDGTAQGHTRNYLELKLPAQKGKEPWKPGQLVRCILKEEYLI